MLINLFKSFFFIYKFVCIDPPGSPEGLKVDKINRNGVRLSWAKPRRDGGAPVKGYVIEKQGPNDEWIPVLDVQDCVAFVPMKQGEQGQFRVKAVNSEGPGDPCKPTSMLTAEDQLVAPEIFTNNDLFGNSTFGIGGLKNVTLKVSNFINFILFI